MWYNRIRSLFNPERYHGWGRRKKYFEGWYYKVITSDEKFAFAFIPGIAMDAQGEKQAFIQVLDGINQTAEYIRFPAEKFDSGAKAFKTSIDGNIFTTDHVKLNLNKVKGELHFSDTVSWPNKWYSPGIMGPYAFVAFMECYHGIVSMDHRVDGTLNIHGKNFDFNNGRGYTEKDWGHSFPSAYVWLQTNHFSAPGISVKVSVAKIPWLHSSFVGFIAGVYLNGQLIQFTTYNGSKLVRSKVDRETVELVLENKNYHLEILVKRSVATELASPIAGFMDGRISESMTSTTEIKLKNKKSSNIVFKDTGRNTALEVAGNISEITID